MRRATYSLLTSLLLFAVLLLPAPMRAEAGDGGFVWDFSRHQAAWAFPRNLEMEQDEEGLRLTITGKDSSIENRTLSLDPRMISRFRIEYKAEGFPGATHGELFFAGSKSPGYMDGNRFFIPSLQSDGKWHTLELTARQLLAGEASWLGAGTIRRIRLDLVNECPGTIVIRRIAALPPILAPLTRIQEVTPSEGILLPRETLQQGAVELKIPRGRHALWLRHTASQSIAQSLLQCVPAYTPEPSKANPHAPWQLLGRVAPGDDGIIALTLKTPLPDAVDSLLILPESAQEAPADRPDTTPRKVTAATGKGPLKLLPAHFDPLAPYFKGKMIAPKGLERYTGRLWLRRRFQAPAELSRALLQLTADDVVESVSINGKPVPGPWTRSWRILSRKSVESLLKPGMNTLEIVYTNNGGVGGCLFELDMLDAAGHFTYVCSDASARGGKGTPEGAGGAVHCENPPPHPPWLAILDYTDLEPARGKASIAFSEHRLECADAESLTVSLKASGEPALGGDEVCCIRLLDAKGTLLACQSARLKEWAQAPDAKGTWNVQAGPFALPRYGSAISGTVEAVIYHREGNASRIPFRIEERLVPSFSGDVERAELVDNGAGPRLEINGKPRFIVGMSTFHELGPTGLEGAGSPVMVRSFLAGSGECDWWVGPGTYDFSRIEEKLSRILRDFPNALIGIWLHCQPPKWYAKRHPERISRESNGGVFDYAVSTVTFSGEEYRKDAAAAVTAFVEHCERHFGRRILIYNLCGGISLEWQGWGNLTLARRGVLADYGPTAARDFVAYANQAAPELGITGIPGYKERVAPESGLFRDPAREAASILYDAYYSHAMADCILELAAAAKSACRRRKLVGCYYGYAFEYANKDFSLNSAGHNALHSIISSPDIDLLLSPPSYGVRTIGSTPGSDMKAFGSVHARGKLSVLEDDTRTHLDSDADFYQTLNPGQTQAVLRRNWGMALAQKTIVWHLPIETNHAFGSPEIRADLQRVARAGQRIAERDLPRDAEIAVVIDEGSRKYLHPRAAKFATPHRTSDYYSHDGRLKQRLRMADSLVGELIYFQRIALNQCGAPVDYLLLEDVPDCASRYRLFILLDAFAPSDKLNAAVAAIRSSGASLLVAYGAGFVGKEDADIAGMRLKRTAPGPLTVEFRDFRDRAIRAAGENRFGTDNTVEPRFAVADADARILGVYPDNRQAAVAVKPLGDSGGKVWFCGSNVLPAGFIAAIAADSGVHLYSAPGDTLFAGCGTVTLHSATSGRKTIRLPRKADVVDMYTGAVVARDVDEFQFEQEAYTTRTFLLGEAANILDCLKEEHPMLP